MFDRKRIQVTMQRLTDIRARILMEYPFFGQLLMYLGIGLAKCETAYTDMKRIVFDPDFVDRLDDEELIFLMLHEVMHCVLKHCIRGKNLEAHLYNVSCDIVVNSNILQTMGLKTFAVDGLEVMHLVPDGTPGYLFTAEEVYRLLEKQMKAKNNLSQNGSKLSKSDDTADSKDRKGSNSTVDQKGTADQKGTTDSKGLADSEDMIDSMGTIDSHEEWDEIEESGYDVNRLDQIIIDTAQKTAGHELSQGIRHLIDDLNKKNQVDWRKLLQEFMQLHYDRFDFTFIPSDRRFTYLDYALPSFHEVEDEVMENIWFVVDASGSVSDDMLNAILVEVRAVTEQFEHLSCKLSFFDTSVTEPITFSKMEDLKNIKTPGGGGTSFHAIFRYMKQNMSENLPAAMVIITDGFAEIPSEERAMGVPVMWMICDSGVEPDWGTTVKIQSVT